MGYTLATSYPILVSYGNTVPLGNLLLPHPRLFVSCSAVSIAPLLQPLLSKTATLCHTPPIFPPLSRPPSPLPNSPVALHLERSRHKSLERAAGRGVAVAIGFGFVSSVWWPDGEGSNYCMRDPTEDVRGIRKDDTRHNTRLQHTHDPRPATGNPQPSTCELAVV